MPSLFPALPSITIPSWLGQILQSIWTVWSAVWWIVLPAVALIIFWEAWLIYLHYRFTHSIRWKLLEIKVPKMIVKTPKAMEQIFAAAHAPYSYGISNYKKYWQGIEEYWMVFELIGRGGETHFYLRLPAQFQNMMESAIYAQYPEAEITEPEDYLHEFPEVLPNTQFDISGFEEVTRHENYLPIRTYLSFEELLDERRIDPIAPLMEAMGKLKDDEQLWFQVLITPTGEEFKKEGEEAVKKIMGIAEEEHKSSGGFLPSLGITAEAVLKAPFVHPGEEAEAPKEEKKERKTPGPITQSDKNRIDGISAKIAKLAFEATLRFVYISRQGAPDSGHTNSIHGFVRQFNTQDMNSLRPNSATSTASYSVKGLFKKTRVRMRKRLMFDKYHHLYPTHHPESILNIEELATLYHFPLSTVSAPDLQRVESRKGSPPPTLPIIEE